MTLMRTICCFMFSLLFAFQAQALNILLTNDDGYDHPWINAVRDSLLAAGHEVTVVAPAVNQSGQSAALTLDAMRNKDAIRRAEPGVYAVEGTPATAVILAVEQVMTERPDLVVSGTNDGANIGVLSSFSGTVGATVAALNLVGEPIPAIAISSNRLDQSVAPGEEPNLGHAREIADFLVGVVAGLDASRAEDGALLPRGIALNINYPALPRDQVKGAGIYRHGPVDRTLFSAGGAAAEQASSGNPEWDTTALAQGHITIVPINGDYTAPQWREVVPAGRLGIEEVQ